MLAQKVFWVIVILGAPAIFTYLFLINPYLLIRWQGKFYKFFYKDRLEKFDDELRSIYQLPTDHFLMGERDDFIQEAATSPEKFHRLANVYRLLGCLSVGMFIAVLILLIMALQAGTI